MEGLGPTKLPSTLQVTCLQWSAPGPVRGQLAGPSPLICIFISFRATSFPVSDVAGQFPHTHHLILFCMPFSMSGMLGTTLPSHKCLALSLSSPLPTPSFSSCVTSLLDIHPGVQTCADNTSVSYNGYPSTRRGGLHRRQSSLQGIRLHPSGGISLSLPFVFNMYS